MGRRGRARDRRAAARLGELGGLALQHHPAVWLGLTVLLNAERRTWGIWLAGGGLLLGRRFFISHSAMLGFGLATSAAPMDFWWQLGGCPPSSLPLAWYVVMLWYAGFWDDRRIALRRQRPWLALPVVLALGLTGLLLFANPLPSYAQMSHAHPRGDAGDRQRAVAGPWYPFIISLHRLSLDALRKPRPSATP